MFSTDDTIVAVATPAGRGGVAVARLSGPAAHEIALGLAGRRRPLVARRATRARLSGLDVADDALLTFFPAPASYTGEDVVEVSTHGSPVVMAAVLAAAPGAAPGRRGRASSPSAPFSTASSICCRPRPCAELVEAVSPAHAAAAAGHLDGALSAAVARLARRAAGAAPASRGVDRLSGRGVSLHRPGRGGAIVARVTRPSSPPSSPARPRPAGCVTATWW